MYRPRITLRVHPANPCLRHWHWQVRCTLPGSSSASPNQEIHGPRESSSCIEHDQREKRSTKRQAGGVGVCEIVKDKVRLERSTGFPGLDDVSGYGVMIGGLISAGSTHLSRISVSCGRGDLVIVLSHCWFVHLISASFPNKNLL